MSSEVVSAHDDEKKVDQNPSNLVESDVDQSDDEVGNENSADELIRSIRVNEPDAVDLTKNMQAIIDTRYYNCTIRRYQGATTVGWILSEKKRLRKQYEAAQWYCGSRNGTPSACYSLLVFLNVRCFIIFVHIVM